MNVVLKLKLVKQPLMLQGQSCRSVRSILKNCKSNFHSLGEWLAGGHCNEKNRPLMGLDSLCGLPLTQLSYSLSPAQPKITKSKQNLLHAWTQHSHKIISLQRLISIVHALTRTCWAIQPSTQVHTSNTHNNPDVLTTNSPLLTLGSEKYDLLLHYYTQYFSTCSFVSWHSNRSTD